MYVWNSFLLLFALQPRKPQKDYHTLASPVLFFYFLNFSLFSQKTVLSNFTFPWLSHPQLNIISLFFGLSPNFWTILLITPVSTQFRRVPEMQASANIFAKIKFCKTKMWILSSTPHPSWRRDNFSSEYSP